VAHHDRPPAGDELAFFTSSRASEYDEHWVGVDLADVSRVTNAFLDAAELMRRFPSLGSIP
jgi:hypothetical protein